MAALLVACTSVDDDPAPDAGDTSDEAASASVDDGGPVGTGADPDDAEATDVSDEYGDGSGLASVDDYYAQELDWTPCFSGFECARVLAPLDWAEPTKPSIELVARRTPATGAPEQRIGSLLLNPGGPGLSGIESLTRDARQGISLEVREHYDLVGFDPRGVGLSTPVECGDVSVHEHITGVPIRIDDEASIERARERHRGFGEACLEGSGELLGHVDTASTARDMDLMRALLGDDRLHYLGYSYGTFLGATYAELFPERVGRLVLDSAADFSLTSREIAVQQAEALENALRDYVADCQTSDCPLAGSVEDGMAEIVAMVEARDAEPFELAGGRRLTGATVLGLVSGLLTLEDAHWSTLTSLLERWDDEEVWTRRLAQVEDGTSSFLRSHLAVNCLDHPTPVRDLAGAVELRDELAEVAPVLGDLLAPGLVPTWMVGCGEWPVEPVREPAPTHAVGAAPILVVGVTGDRTTPYAWSVSLAEQLESGVLLTWDGDRHMAYGHANDCLHDAVDAYLIDGVLPDEGTVC